MSRALALHRLPSEKNTYSLESNIIDDAPLLSLMWAIQAHSVDKVSHNLSPSFMFVFHSVTWATESVMFLGESSYNEQWESAGIQWLTCRPTTDLEDSGDAYPGILIFAHEFCHRCHGLARDGVAYTLARRWFHLNGADDFRPIGLEAIRDPTKQEDTTGLQTITFTISMNVFEDN